MHALPTASSDADFDNCVIGQYEEFQNRNAIGTKPVPPPTAVPLSVSEPLPDAAAKWKGLETPITKLKELIECIEKPIHPCENRAKVTLTSEQVLACARFGSMLQTV